MTDPRTPADAITRAADRIRAQKEAARALANELAAQRADIQADADSPQETVTR